MPPPPLSAFAHALLQLRLLDTCVMLSSHLIFLLSHCHACLQLRAARVSYADIVEKNELAYRVSFHPTHSCSLLMTLRHRYF